MAKVADQGIVLFLIQFLQTKKEIQFSNILYKTMLLRLFLSILFNEKFNLLLRIKNFQDSSHSSLSSEGTISISLFGKYAIVNK